MCKSGEEGQNQEAAVPQAREKKRDPGSQHRRWSMSKGNLGQNLNGVVMGKVETLTDKEKKEET